MSPDTREQNKTLDEFERINGRQNKEREGEARTEDSNNYAETGAHESLSELSSAAERYIGNMESELQTLQKVFLFLISSLCLLLCFNLY